MSVPHDGLSATGLFGQMVSGRRDGVTVKDKNVWPIATDTINSCRNVSAIRGLMSRCYIDYNRSWPDPVNYYPETQPEVDVALDDDRLSWLYQTYHRSIDNLIGEAVDNFGHDGSLLVDLHGFSVQPPDAPKPNGYDLILGTGNRQSILFGDVDVAMGIFFRRRGYSLFVPESTSTGGEVEGIYSADFTTRHHSETMNVNTIQIEIASKFRDSQTGGTLGPKLANDFAEFLNYFFGKKYKPLTPYYSSEPSNHL